MEEKYSQHVLNGIAYKGTFMMDEIAVVAAFFTAIIIRFNAIMTWEDRSLGVYLAMLITAIIFELIVSTFYDQRRTTIVNQDPFENLVSLIKSRFLLIALTIMYFVATHRDVFTTRIVFIIFMTLSVIYGYILRMAYRRYFKKNYAPLGAESILRVVLPLSNSYDLKKEIREGSYTAAVIVQGNSSDEEAMECCRICDAEGLRTYHSLENMGYTVRAGLATNIDGYTVIPAFVRKDKFNVLGTRFAISRTEEAVLSVIRGLDKLSGKYICFSNVHTTVMAKDDPNYQDILNGAAYVFADGTPIAKLQRKRGNIGADRVAGPDFMEHMFRDTADGSVSHFFYGASPKTIEALEKNLKEKYPGMDIRGLYSPPFRPLSKEEDEADIKMINDSGADIVWIGLGAPKQEKWMRAHEGKINGVMMGVGAGFDFHAGTTKRAPLWIQKIGLEWLFRLFQNPKRLIKRYLVTNVKFSLYILKDIVFKRVG